MTRATLALLLGLTCGTAHAQLALGAASRSVAPPAGVAPVRWPAVAYSPDDDVFLAVSGAGHVAGYWLDGGGVPLDAPFVIDADAAFAQAPRVAYADHAFVVTWHETIAGGAVRVRGRTVARGGALGADFDVSPVGTNWEMGAPAVWSSASHALLVAWHSTVDTRIYAQRLSATGAPIDGPITIDARALYFRDPSVAYHAATDTFFVAYAGCVGTNDCFVSAQRVQASTGALVSGPIVLDASIEAGYVPEIAYDARGQQMLVVWDRMHAGRGGFYGRTIDGAGTPSAAAMLVTDTVGAYDANALAYDDLSGTFVLVTHGSTQRDAALELSAQGIPLGAPVPFGPTSVAGNFNPRVVARAGHAEWLAVTSSDFATLTAQQIVTATRAPSDAGVAGVDAGAATDAGADAATDAAPDARARDAGPRTSASAGCSCRALGPVRPRAALSLLAPLVVLVTLRRARSRVRAAVGRAAHRV